MFLASTKVVPADAFKFLTPGGKYNNAHLLSWIKSVTANTRALVMYKKVDENLDKTMAAYDTLLPITYVISLKIVD